MIDQNGYRANIAIVLTNNTGQVAWFKRCGQSSWQFPQGGLRENESYEQGMYRELSEETGLAAADVKILGRTDDWLYYDLPEQLIKKDGICIGQKQIWFLLKLTAEQSSIDLNMTNEPEFESWCWVDKAQAQNDIIYFKKDVYSQALAELSVYWP